MKRLKNALSIRGDCLYCPLPLALDAYWNCLTDCHHCYFRHLNHTWGTDLRPADPEDVQRKLQAGVKNKTPKTPLAHALASRKTLRLGNKSDPFQEAERTYHVARDLVRVLTEERWTFVIQTRFTGVMMETAMEEIKSAHFRRLLQVMPVVSPGLDRDWEVLERGRTTPPRLRLSHLSFLRDVGVPYGLNGEPFIPGYHTVEDFKSTMQLLRDHGIDRYNTYNFHFNAFVAKRLHAIGVDIERIWYHNQDEQWRPILAQLLQLGETYGVRIGCPDFVNSGKAHREPANTCCGLDVPRPCTYNAHTWKRMLQEGRDPQEILAGTWDGVGDQEEGRRIMEGTTDKMYTMHDAGFGPEEERDETGDQNTFGIV